MKKICIIGGSGFVGTRLIELLISKYSIINIDKNQSNKFPQITLLGDIRNKDFLVEKLKNFDLVVLLAAEHRDDVSPISLYFDVNVLGAENVLDAMEKNHIKEIIFTSSVAVYGLDKNETNENSPIDPFNHYGRSKWQAEERLRNWFEKDSKNRKLTIIRPTVIFGEQNRGNVFNLFTQIANGWFFMIGSGKNLKSMSYIGNISAFIEFAIEACEGYQLFNYVDKPDNNMIGLIVQVEKSLNIIVPKIRIPYYIGLAVGYFFDLWAYITKRKYAISSVRVRKFCATTSIASIKLTETSFKPPFTLNEGLDKTLKYEFLNKRDGEN